MPDPITFDVLVPEKLEGLPRREAFVVRDGVAKLRAVYGEPPESLQGWLSFDAYGLARARMDPTWPNRLAGADLVVGALVGDPPGEAQVNAVLQPEVRDAVDAALAAVPTDWALADALAPEAWERLRALYAALDVPSMDLRCLTRVLSVKRPRLVPAIPGHARARARRPLADIAMEATLAWREVMVRNRLALAEITAAMNAWLEKVTPASRRARLTPARTMAELLRFELGGFRRFAGWEERDGTVRRRVAGAPAPARARVTKAPARPAHPRARRR
jgi:hypothetical protein